MGRPATLSPIRKQIFDFIVEYKAENDGCAPSMHEMADKFHRSTNTISYDLTFLQAIGLIELDNDGKSRMIKVVGAKWVAPLSDKPTSPHLDPSTALRSAQGEEER